MREYNQVFPGCAERIVAMAEAESLHRREEERGERLDRHAVIQSEISTQRIGMWMAFLLSLLVIALSAFLLYTGHLAWGIGLVGAELVSLVSLFLYGKKRDTDLLKADAESEQRSLPFPD